MFEKLKLYFVENVSKRYVPVGVMAATACFATFYATNQGAFEQYGINYIPQWTADWLATHAISGPILLIELDTTNQAIIALIIGLIAMAARAGQHHTTGSTTVPTVEKEN